MPMIIGVQAGISWKDFSQPTSTSIEEAATKDWSQGKRAEHDGVASCPLIHCASSRSSGHCHRTWPHIERGVCAEAIEPAIVCRCGTRTSHKLSTTTWRSYDIYQKLQTPCIYTSRAGAGRHKLEVDAVRLFCCCSFAMRQLQL